MGGFCPGGLCPEDFVHGDFVRGEICPGRFCPRIRHKRGDDEQNDDLKNGTSVANLPPLILAISKKETQKKQKIRAIEVKYSHGDA